ncbi:uncharacterized protein, partial [Parasteatoda tepidariorum]|uniref:uncharacterized protein n=1 Tax=Parasteatoda tepidariorum TaxID=114398 RepID=UPI001C71D600
PQSPRRENIVRSALQVPGEASSTLGSNFKRQTADGKRGGVRRSSIPIFRAHSDGNLHDYKPSPRLGTSRNKSLSTPSINQTDHNITPRSDRQMSIIKESGSSPSDLRHSDTEISPSKYHTRHVIVFSSISDICTSLFTIPHEEPIMTKL